MPQPTKGPRLGGSPAHQKMMLANLATSLFTHGKIHTTRAKAERLRPYAEQLITKAKRGDLHNRRLIGQVIRDKDVVHRLMAEIGPFFADRPGGYTRITKTLPRKGDNAPMAIIELVSERTASAEASQATRTASRRGSTPEVGGTATGAAATAATIADAESDASPENTEIGAVTDDTAAVASAEDAVGTESESPEVPEAEAAQAPEVSEGSETSEGSEVPEPMAEAAAENAGLDTDAEASPEDRS